ncbi:MAG TPA: saccharopine dehydrogenase C-terminal domain-containing protein [Bacteroidales bacterium]|nr:saccharopine dehydrogenase C-terminal domain-containing protein [Bacteroidales bacterium]
MKKVLILGAGLVVKPMVEFLLENRFSVMVASRTREKADDLIKGHPMGSSLGWSIDDKQTLEKLIDEYDIAVSLLPYRHHTEVARVCIRHGKPLVTTSYVQKDMFDLDEAAKNAGVILLNEIGLDPGIDHMSAMRIIDHIHNTGGDVKEFYSLCGALPAPEAANNPMNYKFSWSPEGVVLASRNSAQYLKKGKKVYIEPVNLFKDRFNHNFPGIGALEVYPNRDSISYIDIYSIPETSTMYRGTFRFKGWCETLDAMKSMNMLDDTVSDFMGNTLIEFLAERSGFDNIDLKKNIAIKLGIPEASAAIRSLDFLGFFSDEKIQEDANTPFKITAGRMINKMLLSKEERDMVLLQHIFLAAYPDGKREVIKSSMIDFGSPATNTSIARTVALPAAIAVKQILEKKIDLSGVFRPVLPEIYNPILYELKALGIDMKEEYGLPESEMIK